MDRYFLLKTEAQEFSLEDFKKQQISVWNGVRNPQAVKNLKAMETGDLVLIYHTGTERAVVGVGEVVGQSRADPKDSKSWLRDIKYVGTLKTTITLAEVKANKIFSDWALVRQSRLSVMPVPENFVKKYSKILADLY
jgi:predicted RNA-binding protein with PUA-like domain